MEARHPDGRVEVLFHTASPFETPGRMAELAATTEATLGEGEVHPLVVAAWFVVEFPAIHPFQDGNGRSLRAQQKNLLAKLDVERSMVRLSEIQQRMLDMIDDHGSVTSSVVSSHLDIPPRTVRYHLDVLIRHGLVVPRGEKRGRTYQRATGAAVDVGGEESKTAAILAEILESGGRVGRKDLKRLVESHGYDPRVVGTLHGKRLAHLRRNRRTGVSELTSRGREVAEQYLFARRLAEGARRSKEGWK